MINELQAVEKLIKDRLTEKSTDLIKHLWDSKESDRKDYFIANSYMGRAYEIELYSKVLSIIRDEIKHARRV